MRENPLLVAKHFNRRKQAFLNYLLHGKSKPLGDIIDYFLRIEFQLRGSPHIHMFLWVKDSPDLQTKEGCLLAPDFIDKYVSTTIPDESDLDLRTLVETLQTHHHTKTCLKKYNRCRFDFPKPPTAVTRIKTNADEGNPSRFYVTKRTPSDCMINAYNSDILKIWRANMDIQLIQGVYGVAMYICTYICKSEPQGLKLAITKALDALPENSSQRKYLHTIGSVVLSHREISAQEVAYRMINLPLVESSVKTIYLNCRKPDKRHKVLKSNAERQQLDDDSEDIFQTGLPDYYSIRPKGNKWDKMSLATFVSWYKLCSSNQHSNHRQPCYELLNSTKRVIQRKRSACLRMPKLSLHTDTDEYFYSKLYAFLPFRNEQELVYPYTNAYDAFIAKRSQFDASACSVANIHDELIKAVHIIRSMESGEIDIAPSLTPNTTHMEENIENTEDQRPKDYDFLQPTQNEVEHSYIDQKNQPTPQQNLTLKDTDPVDCSLKEDWANLSMFTMTDCEYLTAIATLTQEQNQILQVINNHITSTKSPTKSAEKVPTKPLYLFISGGAGTGKSYLIKIIKELIIRKTRTNSVMLTSPTGCAAYGIGGKTLHSAFNLPVQHPKSKLMKNYLPLSNAKRDHLQTVYLDLQYLIIDEISMVSDHIFHCIHHRLQEIKCAQQSGIFGNCSVITFGDFYQLQPVAAHYVFDQTNFSGISNLWIKNIVPFFLTTNVRQLEDPNYAALLNRVRTGEQTVQDITILSQRTSVDCSKPPFINALRLYPTRKQCRQYNNTKLNELAASNSSEVTIIEAIDTTTNNDMVPKNLVPTDDSECGGLPHTLSLVPGARVMLLRNIMTTEGLVNGAQGTIETIVWSQSKKMPSGVYIKFDNPNVAKVLQTSDVNSVLIKPFTTKFFGKEGTEIQRTQLPLLPSWAITIHKSQGMTVSHIIIDLGHKCTKPGQAYVALSRVKSLTGLALIDFTEKAIRTSKKVISEMERLKNLL